MNQNLLKFATCLQASNERGISEWGDAVFTKSLIDQLGSSQCPSLEYLKTLFLNIFGEDLEVKTFVLKKSPKFSPELSTTHNDPFDGSIVGSPLILQENRGDFSCLKGDDPTLGLDQDSLISEHSVRQIVSSLNLLLNQSENRGPESKILKNLFPILIFCKWNNHDRDPNGIMYIRSQNGPEGKILGLVEQYVTLSGPYNSDTWRRESNPGSSPSNGDRGDGCSHKFHSKCIETLVKRHRMGVRQQERCPVTMTSFSQFELFRSSKQLLDDMEKDMALASVTVDITCNKVQQILGINKQRIEEVKINVTPVPGDMRNSAYLLYKAIQVLEGFFCAFGESGEVCLTSVDKSIKKDPSDNSAEIPVLDQIKNVIASYNSEWMFWNTERKKEEKENQKDKNESETAEDTSSRQMFAPREELDFTEKVWEILQFVGSCEELVACFTFILKEITEGRATQFWLHRNNSTTLAKLIQESYKGSVTSQPKLTKPTCIRLLIELGMDKLLRDYINFFKTNQLASASRLAPYSGENSTAVLSGSEKDEVNYLQKKFILLKKLHHIVELVVQCKLFLYFSNEQTFSVTRTALQDYISEELDFNKTFSFSINFSEIESMVESSVPSVWRLMLTSGEKNALKTTNVCWMADYPYRGVIAPSPTSDLNMSVGVSAGKSFSVSSFQHDMIVKYHVATQETSRYVF